MREVCWLAHGRRRCWIASCVEKLTVEHRADVQDAATSDCDWLTVVRAVHVSHCEFRRLGYPQPFLVQCLAKALPGLLRLNPRWCLVSAVFSKTVGCRWRPWNSLR
jgi:hypothetical protein